MTAANTKVETNGMDKGVGYLFHHVTEGVLKDIELHGLA